MVRADGYTKAATFAKLTVDNDFASFLVLGHKLQTSSMSLHAVQGSALHGVMVRPCQGPYPTTAEVAHLRTGTTRGIFQRPHGLPAMQPVFGHKHKYLNLAFPFVKLFFKHGASSKR